ncbi:hypothetical protein FA13DRAFT_7609 [Coprinellus micaceus]|uniref:F-box domain-containing protein n=1 Tax=Coprinellus micaceus TaxID=71717 RepID=A0A4Y7TZC2_COPMI|nr:hypothetical protein FA13DRAFT_7609 [Coprinellus micaceus]
MSTFSRPLPDLPNELICKILDNIGYKADLIAVSLLSRSWLNCSRERLFKDITFKNRKSLVQFAKFYHSPYRTIPDTFQHVYLNPCHWDPFTAQDRVIVFVTLALIASKEKFTIRASGKAVIPNWPLTATKGQWASIRHLELIGGIYSAPKFFEYIGSFPKLELLHLYAASFHDGWEEDTVHYSFPPPR